MLSRVGWKPPRRGVRAPLNNRGRQEQRPVGRPSRETYKKRPEMRYKRAPAKDSCLEPP